MKYFALLFCSAIFVLSSCSKGDDPLDIGDGTLSNITSHYQTYSYGELNELKTEWEKWEYNGNGDLSLNKLYESYEYNDRVLTPVTREFEYNSDGTLNQIEQKSAGSKVIYKYVYETGSLPTKRETWRESGLASTDFYTYDGDLLIEERGSSIVQYSYNSQGFLVEEEYFKDDNRNPWHKYVYERDSKGNELKKLYVNLENGSEIVYNTAKYSYDDKGEIIRKEFKEGILGKDYDVSYEYNDGGSISKEHVKRKNSSGSFDDWMLITYEYSR